MAFSLIFFMFAALCCLKTAAPEGKAYWRQYGRDEKGQRFSPLTQINRDNVNQTRVAWTYHYGRAGDNQWAHEATPIMITDGSTQGRDLLIFCTPWNDLIALEPTTGNEVWKQTGATIKDPDFYTIGPKTCRGVAAWLDPLKKDGALCRQMVYMGTLAAMLVAVDAATGQFCPEFGDRGWLNLTVPGAIIERRDGRRAQMYGFSTGPVIVGDTVVIGDNIDDELTSAGAKGQPRGFHCRTGRKKWTFHVIPENEADPAYRTWWNGTKDVGGGNVWAPISGDDETGLVYLATSSASYDHWGGNRKGENEYTDSVVAVDAETGGMKWYYQIIKHDLWNYDLGSQPIVVTIDHEGTRKKAVLTLTKTGMLFILDAATGQPLFPVEERPVPPHTMPDDYAWPTQRFPVGDLGHLIPQNFSMDDLFRFDDEHYNACRDILTKDYNIPDGKGKLFTPPTTDRGVLQVPGELGGGNWQSLAVHPEKQIAYLPLNHLITVRQVLQNNETGSGFCRASPVDGSPYHSCRGFFGRTDLSVPCYKPPWARLVAVDLSQGKIKWERPYATPLLVPAGLKREYGARRVIGGVIVTASGLVFATGGEDLRLWAYDADTGEELWGSDEMKYEATSVPMTYLSGGRQYVILNVAGHWTSLFPRGDMIYAFALPENYTDPKTTNTPEQTTVNLKPTASVGTQCYPSILTICLILFSCCNLCCNKSINSKAHIAREV